MTDAFTTAATEAARKRLSWHDMQFGDIMRPMAWMAEWARDHLAAQEPTDAEVEAAQGVILACIWSDAEEDAPQGVIEYARDQARATLFAAKEARS